MERAFLKKAAIQSVALMLGVIVLSYAIKQYNGVAISASNKDDITPEAQTVLQNAFQEMPTATKPIDLDTDAVILEEPHLIFTDAETNISADIIKQLGDRYLVIRKPRGSTLQIHLEDLFITRNLRLNISGFMDENLDANYIGRANGEEIFIGEPAYLEGEIIEPRDDGDITSTITRGIDPVNGIEINSLTDDLGHTEVEIMLLLDHVYVHILYEDKFYYYIDLRTPREVYDKILVIDAGHGGKDPGAVSRDELIYEKSINLSILLELKELLDKENIKVYYTRVKDDKLFLRPRVALANDIDCDFFISIHNNSSSISTKRHGTEILYYNHEHKGIRTKDMAKIFNDEISKTVPLKNNGIVQMKNDDVLILNHATVPAIIIEGGYVSNINDLNYLNSKAGQVAFADGIYKGILRAYEELLP